MKAKFIPLLAIVFAGVVMGVTSCGPSAEEKRQKAVNDSLRMVDSLAKVEEARIAALREDSIRRAQDSIQQAERELQEFASAIPSVSEIDRIAAADISRLSSMLASRGFKMSSKNKTGYDYRGDEPEAYTWKAYYYTLEKGDKKCVITNDRAGDDESMAYMITIKGAPEVLNNYYSDTKKAVEQIKRQHRSEYGPWVDSWYAKKVGNNVVIGVYGGD